ncbi:MAG: sel1 repeat family protein [Prevotellaceae bacterium]|jgi:TPR repeat protein|nr:sel1 repeat family protein [Prevotellaceae bacterium]
METRNHSKNGENLKLLIIFCITVCVLISCGEQKPKPSDFSAYAEQGDIEAQCNLGLCYLFGWGTVIDLLQAEHWLDKAAGGGYPLAIYTLGYCYDEGVNGMKKNLKEALYFYQNAKLFNNVFIRRYGESNLSNEQIVKMNARIKELEIDLKPTGTIENVWLEHNVSKNGQKGINIHINFSVKNMNGIKGICYASFFLDGEDYATYKGSTIYDDFIPLYDTAKYQDFILFLNYSYLQEIIDEYWKISEYKYKLKVNVEIGEGTSDVFSKSDFVYFTFNTIPREYRDLIEFKFDWEESKEKYEDYYSN